MDVILRDIKTDDAIRAIHCAKSFLADFPMKSGIRDGCIYSFGGVVLIYVYRTKAGNLVCRYSQ